ncbi:hypothetical protein [Actinomyces marmotae]|uniref:hypothetical protein n=1 Tax=Actinomyces marmotae TaxID=2737173 RepID=UPI00135B1C83|nr:hypothetical protein [Actinomyces marmotae]
MAIAAQEFTLDLTAFFLPDADDAQALSILRAWGAPEAIAGLIVDALVLSALIGAVLLLVTVVADLHSARQSGDGPPQPHPGDTTG